MKHSNDTLTSLADQLLVKLSALGCRYFFGNPGSEFAPVIESFAQHAEDKEFIKPFTAPHEYLAVNMAYGAYVATESPQVVMVHASIGAANALAAVMNASRMQIPFIFIAGRTPIHEEDAAGARDKFVHWAQETFDQAAPLREFVKWDYELRDPKMLNQVLDRAYQVAMEEPRGPVYLTIPRELLLEPAKEELVVTKTPTLVSKFIAPEASLSSLREEILKAQRPIVLTKTLGKSTEGFDTLELFCDKFGLGAVFQDAHYCNMRFDHPMHLGYSSRPLLEWSDLILILDVDVPWLQSAVKPLASTKIMHIGHDPLFKDIPIRTHRGDMFLKSDPILTLKVLNNYEVNSSEKALIDQKKIEVDNLKKSLESKDVSTSESKDSLRKLNVADVIADCWSNDLVLINELSLPIESIPFESAHSYFRTGSASGLGWACGFALGQQICRPDKVIVNVVGDGSYIFGNPSAYHWVAMAYNLPIVTLILNNGGMKSIQRQTIEYAPEGHAARRNSFSLSEFSNPLKYHLAAPSFSGQGELIESKQQLNEAFRSALQCSRDSKKQSLLNIIVSD